MREMLGLKDGLLSKLHEDHEEVAGLIEQILKAKDAGKRRAFRDMKAKLLAHAKAEQKILYKPMEKKGEEEARKFALEGDVEHESSSSCSTSWAAGGPRKATRGPRSSRC